MLYILTLRALSNNTFKEQNLKAVMKYLDYLNL